MAQQKALVAAFVAGTISGLTGATITTAEGVDAPAAVRAVVVEDLFEKPTVQHLDKMQAKYKCDIDKDNVETCKWQILVRTKTPPLVPGLDPAVRNASFNLDDRPDLQPVVAGLIDAAKARLCAGRDVCAVSFVRASPTMKEDKSLEFVVNAAGMASGADGEERVVIQYVPDQVVITSLGATIIDLLCKSGGLCPDAATAPDGGV